MAEPPRATPTKWADLGVRTLSAAVLIPAVLVDVWVGGVWFELAIAVVAVLMADEWTTIVHGRHPLQFALHAAAAVGGAVLTLAAGLGPAAAEIAVLWAISAALATRLSPPVSLWHYLGVPYVGASAAALVLLRSDAVLGASVIVWVLVTVWSADTLAYFAGRIIGGPRLAPVLSPKKTWAGLGGAVVGSGLASAIFAAAMGFDHWVGLALFGAGLAIVEQAGDLFKSAMKRHFGVKDSGRLIPGHGGVIDRVDGLVAVSMAAAVIGLIRGGAAATGSGILVW